MRTIGELEYQNAVLQERLDTEIERGNKLACDLDDAKAEIALLQDSRDAAIEVDRQTRIKLNRAEAACAEMRKHAHDAKAVLAYVAYQRLPLGNTVFDTLPEHWQLAVTKALDIPPDDCGTGWLSPELRQQAVEAFKKLIGFGRGDMGHQNMCDLVTETAEQALAALEGGRE